MGGGALLVLLKIFGSRKRDKKILVHIGDSEAMTVHSPVHFDESTDITSHRLAKQVSVEAVLHIHHRGWQQAVATEPVDTMKVCSSCLTWLSSGTSQASLKHSCGGFSFHTAPRVLIP